MTAMKTSPKRKLLHPETPVLVVDDEEPALRATVLALRMAGVTNVLPCGDSREVLPILARQPVQAILLDLTMPFLSGEEVLRQVGEEHPDIPIIVITGRNDVKTAVDCMQMGAFDYMVKPVEERRLSSGVKRALELRELQSENRSFRERVLSDKLERPEAFAEIVTNNPRMRTIFQYLEAVSGTSKPVLITGETGTGKELVARAVHRLSGRAGRFVPINVAGLDDNMFSDTLFGHVKGAFTGADASRGGLIEQAEDGTLFLDEIGDLSMASQVKLLRLLQEQEYLPIGADLPRKSSVRIIVATNQDLDALQRAGQFRKDLYFRLNTHHTHIPPLRERKDDIPLLLKHFLDEAAAALHRKRPTPPRELIDLLSAYHYPGNVRELEAIVFDAVSRHDGGVLSTTVFRSHIEDGLSGEPIGSATEAGVSEITPFSSWPKLPTLKDAAYQLVIEAMSRSNGNQAVAARLLGITRPSLNKRLKRMYDL